MKETESIEITNESVVSKLNSFASDWSYSTMEPLSSDDLIDVLDSLLGTETYTVTEGSWTTDVEGLWLKKQDTAVYKFNNAYGAKLDSYELVDSGYGDAAETYIATHYDGYFDGGARGPGQQLWWQTAVGQSSSGESNVDDATVNQFEDYIEAATGESNPKCTSDGFDISYNPKWVTGKVGNDDYDSPKAVFDGNAQRYTVGPFAVDYIYGGEFAHITELKVYTDASADPIDKVDIVLCNDLKGKVPAPNTTFYIQFDAIPNATKITNIQFDFKYDNGYVYYERYDSPDGYEVSEISIEIMKRTFYKQSIVAPEVIIKESEYTFIGLTRENTITEDAQSIAETGGPSSVTGETSDDSEGSTGGASQNWWTSYTTLNRKSSINRATIQVEKVIEGEKGETLSLADLGLNENSCPSFDFEIQVEGNEKEIISIKPGETKNSKVYEWEGNAPTYTVKECDNQEAIEKLEALGYKIGELKLKYEMSKGTGSYDKSTKVFSGTLPSEGNLITIDENNITASTTVHIQALNKKEPDNTSKEGSLKVIKKFKNYNSSGIGNNQTLLKDIEDKVNSLKDEKYIFDVEIYGNFEYEENDQWIKCTTNNECYKRTVEASVNEPWTAPQIRWYGEAPDYKVIEHEDTTGVTSLVSITPSNGDDSKTSAGKLCKNQIVNVTAENEINFEKAKLKIIKKTNFKGYIPTDPSDQNYDIRDNLKNVYTEEIKQHTFNFELDVENYFGPGSGNDSLDINVSGAIGEWVEEGQDIYYVIEKEINQEFIWVKGNPGLKYELREKDDDKTTFKDAVSNALDVELDKTNKTIKGRLKPDENGLTAEIENTIINDVIDPEYKLKAIELYKIIDNQEELKDKDYKFRVILRGKAFKYGEDKIFATNDPNKDIVVQLTNYGDEKTVVIENDQYDDTKIVTIHIGNDNPISSWQSDTISWCTFVDAPTYTIKEMTQGTEIEETIGNNTNRLDTAMSIKELRTLVDNLLNSNTTNGTGTSSDSSINQYYKETLESIKEKINNEDLYLENDNALFIIAKNTKPGPKTLEGNVAIIKRLENQGLLTDNDIKSLEFSFNIQIENEIPYDVVLKYDENPLDNNLYKIDDKYYWIYTTGRKMWSEDEDAPKYSIIENENTNSEILTSFKNITEEGTKENLVIDSDNKLITGVLSPDLISKDDILKSLTDNSGNINDKSNLEDKLKDVTNLVTVDNELGNEPKTGDIEISKKITNGSLLNNTYNFKVVVSGKFKYNNETIDGKKEFDKIEVSANGDNTKIGQFEWCGESPTVTVEEIDDKYSENIGNRVWTGKLSDSKPYTVVAVNKEEDTSGGLIIKKITTGGNISGNEKCTFKVEIEGKEPYTVEVGANESYDLGKFTWDINKDAPEYKITEINIPSGSTFVSIEGTNGTPDNINHSISGSLSPDTGENQNNIEVKCFNRIDSEDNEGRFKVEKVVSQDFKGGVDLSSKTFTINMLISGTFSIHEDDIDVDIVNGSYKITKEIKANENYTSPLVKWYGSNVPVVKVSEELDSEGEDLGWRLIDIANNNAQIKADDSTVITVTNEIPEHIIPHLTLELAGTVWEDANTNEKGEASNANGIRGSSEKLIQGVEVYIYKYYSDGRRELATVYDNAEGSIINQPIITDYTGHWDAPYVKISDEGYLKEYRFDVEFVYDGQTYEPTKYLALSEYSLENLKRGEEGDRLTRFNTYEDITDDRVKARLYRNSTTSKRNYYQWSSMAKDSNRATVNKRIAEVKGFTAIDGNGNTTGKVVSADGNETYIYYKADNPGKSGSRVESKLKTLNSDGTALDIFKATARTSAVDTKFEDLTYCFDNQISICSVDRTLTGQGIDTTIEAKATFDYCLNINFGLTKRQEADIEAQKDLVEATVVVNDKKMTYSFGKLQMLNKDISNITQFWEDIDNQNLTYKLGLYKTDYYYRAEMYKTSANYDAIKDYYHKLYPKEGIDGTNLEVYLKYKIAIYNGSSSRYIAKVNSIDDYYENSLSLVTEDVLKYIENDNGQERDKDYKDIIASAPKYSKDTFTSNLNYEIRDYNINSSDGITYNKLHFDLGITLESGETAEIEMYFKANTNSVEEVLTELNNYELRNNQKSNIVEVASYSILHKGSNSMAGKIDKDSAPSNIDIINRNEKSWYEEDTDEAPRLEIGFIENSKAVTGTVWEDAKDKFNYGKYDENDEALIGGLTTQLVEKVKIQTKDGYTDYDFVWPTNVPLNDLGGRTIEEVTGFNSTVETSRGYLDENGIMKGVGEYRFKNVPTGNYVVRFLYGNNKIALGNTSNNTGEPQALKADGTAFSEYTYTANYDNDAKGKTPAVYNGQDYQSTAYKVGQTGLINNEWETNVNENERLSDARDSEPRRLEVIANSQTITNVNGEILGSANNIDVSHDDLYDIFYMFADTAKLNLNYDNLNNEMIITGNTYSKTSNTRRYGNKNSVNVNIEHNDYNVVRVDFGLVERPETSLILDKQISQIKIITNDGIEIFNGNFKTSYDLIDKSSLNDNYKVVFDNYNNSKCLVSRTVLDKDNSVGVEVLQQINKEERKNGLLEDNSGLQNFKYINVEERVLQGTTIEISYNIYALNLSEEDYTSSLLDNIEIDSNNSNRIRTSKEIKAELLKLAKNAYEENYNSNKEAIISGADDSYQIGKYLGKYYYRHNNPDDNDKIVTTKVRQVIDYVDNDAVFTQKNNSTPNHSWKMTTLTELMGNGLDENRLLRRDIVASFEILDKKEEEYNTEEKRNIILSVDSLNNEQESLQNNIFEKELKPCLVENQDFNEFGSVIGLTVSKTTSSKDDANNLTYDNLAEIVKFENSVGRRNVTAIPGNCNPKELNDEGEPIGEFNAALKEIDSSATELITFIPPTGIEAKTIIKTELLIMIALSISIIVVGIVMIKKKVLK